MFDDLRFLGSMGSLTSAVIVDIALQACLYTSPQLANSVVTRHVADVAPPAQVTVQSREQLGEAAVGHPERFGHLGATVDRCQAVVPTIGGFVPASTSKPNSRPGSHRMTLHSVQYAGPISFRFT
jgi:hypothetical protein